MANKKSKYQKGDVRLIHRSEILSAPYNPRMIDGDAKKRLKKVLKEHGLVSTLTWNERTGNLISGHQRLTALDSLERTKDYYVEVTALDVDEREEVALNIEMNSQSTQGEFLLEELGDLISDYSFDLDEIGFSQDDMAYMFDGDDRFVELWEPEEVQGEKDKLQDIKDARSKGVEMLDDRNNIAFYKQIVFRDEDEMKWFMKKINTPHFEEFLSMNQLARLVDADLSDKPERSDD
jgi:hypothetical protein